MFGTTLAARVPHYWQLSLVPCPLEGRKPSAKRLWSSRDGNRTQQKRNQKEKKPSSPMEK